MDIIKDLIFSTIFFIFKGNRDFFKLINDFHDKLPPKHKEAKESIDGLNGFTIMDTTKMEMYITTKEIDLFHKKLENFNYNLIFFRRKKIKSYSNNIQKHLKTSGWEKFGIAIVQSIIEDDEQSKPYLFNSTVGKIIGF